jgi:hypothetical protein
MKTTIMAAAPFLTAVPVHGQKPKLTLREALGSIQDCLNSECGNPSNRKHFTVTFDSRAIEGED